MSDKQKGKVKWFDVEKGFGFITNQANEDVFVHRSAVKTGSFVAFEVGESVSFNVETGINGGKNAVDVEAI